MRKFSSKLAGQQSGFTLIELVIVIVIIGILAAVAIPNFTDLNADAKKAKANAAAGALVSWSGTNYARCAGGLTGAVVSAGCNAAGITGSGLTDITSAVETSGACVATVGGIASDPVTGSRTTGATCP